MANYDQDPAFRPSFHEYDIKPIDSSFEGKDIVSLEQFNPESLAILFDETTALKHFAQRQEILKGPERKLPRYLDGYTLIELFYQPSSRTFTSFYSAATQLGGVVIAVQDAQSYSSAAKGESLSDSIKTFSQYGDLIVLRHPDKGSAKEAALASDVPVINAGDGKGEHPTQALLDLFTIQEHVGRLHHLNAVMAGDIVNGRTVHSLLDGLAMYPGNEITLLSHELLRLSEDDRKKYEDLGLHITEIIDSHEIPREADFWYWTRTQAEHFKDEKGQYTQDFYTVTAAAGEYTVTPELLADRGNPEMILMHPLPRDSRINEIDPRVDSDPRAKYLDVQMKNGLYIRMALLASVFGTFEYPPKI